MRHPESDNGNPGSERKSPRRTKKVVVRFNRSRLGLALSFVLAAVASQAARAQTDVALSLYGTFTGTTNYNIDLEHQKSANAAGAIFEFRHIRNPLIGYEATYSFNRANQV